MLATRLQHVTTAHELAALQRNNALFHSACHRLQVGGRQALDGALPELDRHAAAFPGPVSMARYALQPGRLPIFLDQHCNFEI